MTEKVYWKEEPAARTWKLIFDTPEERERAIKQGAMFFTWNRFPHDFNGNGQPASNIWGDLPLDFDDKETPENALKDLKALCLHHLPQFYDLDPQDINFYASGSKGFHAVIPSKVFNAQDGDPRLPLIYRRIVSDWATRFDLKTLDLTLYANGKGKMFRIENVKRNNGYYKVPLALEEVRDLSIDEITELTKAPRSVDRIEEPPVEIEELGNLFRTTRAVIEEELSSRSDKQEFSEETKQRLAGKVAPCIVSILSSPPKKSATVNFNKLVMLVVSYFQSVGFDQAAAWDNVKGFVEDYGGSATYDTPKKRADHWNHMWRYLDGNDHYSFHCAYVLGLKIGGFDCKRCLAEQEQAQETVTLEPEDLSGWLTTEPPEQRWCFEDMIPAGIVAGLNGTGGAGKSFLMETLIVGSALGREMFRLFRPTKAMKVLAYLGEDPSDVTRRRIHAIAKEFDGDPHKLEQQIIENVRLVANKPGPLVEFDKKGNLQPTALFQAIKSQAEQFKPDLIVLDPKSMFYGADENSNDHNTAWVNLLKTLTLDGATVLFSHHLPKGADAFNPDSFRGGGALVAACRWCMGMKVMDEKTATKYQIEDPWNYAHTRVTKANYSPRTDAEFFLKRNESGVLKRVELEGTMLKIIAKKLAELLQGLYDESEVRLSRRDVLSRRDAKDIRAELRTATGATRAVVQSAIEYGIEHEILREVFHRSESGKGNPTHHLYPFLGVTV